MPGTSPESYGLEKGESVRRQASRSWPYLLETWQDEKKRDSRFIRILLRELGFPQHMPDHIAFRALGWDVDLDHRTPNREARAPQSVMQEALNTDDTRLWGLLCNGTTLRLLRDSATLVGSAYVEFDLRAIFDGELFSDFVLLYLACHESRFAIQGDGGPESCYLEQWRTASANQGERVLDQLRKGVEQAISILGTGFIAHPANPHLRGQLAGNELRLDDLNRALLRLVYRLLFWFVAEDRDALLLPLLVGVSAETSARLREARERYSTYFSAARLRQIARRQRGTRHTDLYDAVGLVFDALGSEGGVPELALPGIGGIFETGALRRTADRRPPHQRGPTERDPRARLVQVAGGRPAPPGRLRQPRRRRTRLDLRVPARTDPALRPGQPHVHADRPARQRAQGIRLLLHPDVAGRVPARLGTGPAAGRGDRSRARRRRRSRRCWT